MRRNYSGFLPKKLAYSLLALFITLSLYFLYPLILFVIIYTPQYIEEKLAYNQSFHALYPEREYNDSRIDFYKQELQKSSKGFAHAQGVVEIFEYDAKVVLTLECIEYYLQEDHVAGWLEEGNRIRKNAINKFSTINNSIQHINTSKDSLEKSVNIYNLNLVNKIAENMTNLWHKQSKKSLCDQNLNAKQLYSIFLTTYLAEYFDQYITAKKREPLLHNEQLAWLSKITKTAIVQ